MTIPVRVVVLPHGLGLPLPHYATPDSAGCDLRAALSEPLVLEPGQRHAVPTGLKLAIPPGFEGQVRPRSGLAMRHGVTVANAPGTIDADYRGELKALLVNIGQEPVVIEPGDRIAQLVVAPVVQLEWEAMETLDDTDRGEGGFGSTGK
jgi:dUTP pyrophosphatase